MSPQKILPLQLEFAAEKFFKPFLDVLTTKSYLLQGYSGSLKETFQPTKVLYIPDGCFTEFDDICYFILHLFQVINDSIFNLMMLIESSILLKNHVSCNLC